MTPVMLSDLAFLLGPFAGPLLATIACVAVVATRQPVRLVVAASAMTFVVMASFVTYWFLWGKAFDAADALRPVPARVEQALNVAMSMCALAAVSVAVLGAVAVAASRRRPRRDAMGVANPGCPERRTTG